MNATAAGPSRTVADACRARQARLRTALADLEADAILVGREFDIRYLTDFVGHDSLLLLDADEVAVVSDFRYEEDLEPVGRDGIARVEIGTRHRLERSVRAWCERRGVRRLAIQAEYVTVAERRKLADALGGVALVETTGVVGRLRMHKDAVEIERIERAISIAEEALRATLPTLKPGQTERAIAARLKYEMEMRGALGPSFTPIVAVGANGSRPHHQTGDAVLERGSSLLIDWGAERDGYRSDLTRTYGFGSMPKKIETIHRVVLEAQLAAIDACAPGKTCAEVDDAARAVIRRAGYGERFGHGLGHGLGIETHEPPYFNELQNDVVVEPGLVMTIEPGIYLPGVGGVRIEDDVLVTDRGCRVLSSLGKDLTDAVVDA